MTVQNFVHDMKQDLSDARYIHAIFQAVLTSATQREGTCQPTLIT